MGRATTVARQSGQIASLTGPGGVVDADPGVADQVALAERATRDELIVVFHAAAARQILDALPSKRNHRFEALAGRLAGRWREGRLEPVHRA